MDSLLLKHELVDQHKRKKVKPKVYVETSVISYLASRLSTNLIVAAHQQLTLTWWEERSKFFALFVSQPVIEESSAGDKNAAAKRMALVRKIDILDISDEVIDLAQHMIHVKAVPKKAVQDAYHVAVSAVHGMDYLLTWNCKHIANAEMRLKIQAACRDQGFTAPVICTPQELSGG